MAIEAAFEFTSIGWEFGTTILVLLGVYHEYPVACGAFNRYLSFFLSFFFFFGFLSSMGHEGGELNWKDGS
jgi:hypothetical protein